MKLWMQRISGYLGKNTLQIQGIIEKKFQAVVHREHFYDQIKTII